MSHKIVWRSWVLSGESISLILINPFCMLGAEWRASHKRHRQVQIFSWCCVLMPTKCSILLPFDIVLHRTHLTLFFPLACTLYMLQLNFDFCQQPALSLPTHTCYHLSVLLLQHYFSCCFLPSLHCGVVVTWISACFSALYVSEQVHPFCSDNWSCKSCFYEVIKPCAKLFTKGHTKVKLKSSI